MTRWSTAHVCSICDLLQVISIFDDQLLIDQLIVQEPFWYNYIQHWRLSVWETSQQCHGLLLVGFHGTLSGTAWHDIDRFLYYLYYLHQATVLFLFGYVIGYPDFVLIDLEISNIGSNADFSPWQSFVYMACSSHGPPGTLCFNAEEAFEPFLIPTHPTALNLKSFWTKSVPDVLSTYQISPEFLQPLQWSSRHTSRHTPKVCSLRIATRMHINQLWLLGARAPLRICTLTAIDLLWSWFNLIGFNSWRGDVKFVKFQLLSQRGSGVATAEYCLLSSGSTGWPRHSNVVACDQFLNLFPYCGAFNGVLTVNLIKGKPVKSVESLLLWVTWLVDALGTIPA